jgi:hypothetical protein
MFESDVGNRAGRAERSEACLSSTVGLLFPSSPPLRPVLSLRVSLPSRIVSISPVFTVILI